MDHLNMDNVAVQEEVETGLTDLQEYGISGILVTMLSNIRKYIILTQIQMELQNKSHQIQPIMREIYQFNETEKIMDIRANLDMVFVYTKDPVILNNFQMIRDKFENAISFLTNSMQKVTSVLDKNYIEILDEFTDKLQSLATDLATKSIYDTHYKIS